MGVLNHAIALNILQPTVPIHHTGEPLWPRVSFFNEA